MNELLKDVLVLDIETTGLVAKGLDYKNDFEQFPHVVEIAWSMNGVEKRYIIKPEGWMVPIEATEIHGISHDQAVADGTPFVRVITEFVADTRKANLVVGHNIYFDTSIIKANVLRLRDAEFYALCDEGLDKYKRVDTMMKCIKFVGVTFPNSKRLKFPKLAELHYKLFGEGFPEHNALDDVRAVLRCLPELVKEGIIELKRREPTPAPLEFNDPNPVTKPIGIDKKAVVDEFVEKTTGAPPATVGDVVKEAPKNELLDADLDDF